MNHRFQMLKVQTLNQLFLLDQQVLQVPVLQQVLEGLGYLVILVLLVVLALPL